MATTKQAAEIFERRLGLPAGHVAWQAVRLRQEGLLPSTQGVATDLSQDQLAALFIAAVVGTRAKDEPVSVATYLALREGGWGRPLGTRLAAYLGGETGLYEARFELAASSATLIIMGGPALFPETYADPSVRPPAFKRTATISGALIETIATEIKLAPPARPGRKPLRAYT